MKTGLLMMVLGVLGSVGLARAVEPAPASVALKIDAQPLNTALNEFGKQSGLQVVFLAGTGRGVTAPAVMGRYSPQDALEQLLANTSLAYEFLDERTVAVREGDTISGIEGVEDDAAVRMAQGEAPATAAQGEGKDESVESGKTVEEIIVTAQKRKEQWIDVPASITAISAQEIERRGLTNMDDYLRAVPGVSRMEIGAGRANPIVIRGLSLSPEGDKASVGTYLGEVPLVSSLVSGDKVGSADVALVDMEQIEVLKGPQGTLYGSGSLAGIVRNNPKQPNLQEFQGNISTGYSETGDLGGANYLLNGVLNLPIVEDKLAVRVVGYKYSDSGYIENVAATGGPGVPPSVAEGRAFGATIIDQDNVGQTDRVGGRAIVLWQPTDALNASYTFMRQVTDQDGVPEVHLGLDTYQQAYLQLDELSTIQLGQDSALTINNLTLEYDFSWASLLSSSSQIETKSRLGRDQTFVLHIPLDQIAVADTEEFSQEVRLTSNLGGAFEFLLGGFYEDSSVRGGHGGGAAHWSGDPSLFPLPGAQYLPVVAHQLTALDVQQNAFFGEVSYKMFDALKATLGARTFEYDSENKVYSTFLPAFGLPNPSAVTGRLESNEQGEVFKAALSYEPNSNALVYGQWSQGFRLGGPLARPSNFCDPDGDGRTEIILPNGQTFISAPGRVESDRTNNFELGGKFLLLNGRARINASVYRINWDDIPIDVRRADGSCGTTFNAGKARSEGIEMEGAIRVASGLDLQLAFSYLKAELTEDVVSLGASEGDRLPGSPRFTANAAATYDFTLRDHDAYVRGDVLYVGEFYNNLQQAGIAAGGYYQLNLRSGVSFGSVNADLYVNNVTNSDDLTWIYTTLSTDGRAFRLRPRTIGIQLTVDF